MPSEQDQKPILLSLANVRVQSKKQRPLVDIGELTIRSGECVALVGESGAGKTLLARSILGLIDPPLISSRHLEVHDRTGATVLEDEIRSRLAYVGQDALSALDPLMRVAPQVAEALQFGRSDLPQQRRTHLVNRALKRAHLDPTPELLRSYPFMLSGGMRQRALIAAATVAEPDIIIADEPTTALDATVQRRVLATLRTYVDAGAGLLLISHDLAAVSLIADRVLVMNQGRVVESGTTHSVFHSPQTAVSRTLVAAQVGVVPPRDETTQIHTGARIEVRNLSVKYPGATKNAVSHLDFDVRAGKTLGIVGESGSGKTTVGRAILGVVAPCHGSIKKSGDDSNQERVAVGWVPQNARDSFTPGVRVNGVLTEALRLARKRKHGRRQHSVTALLERVGLPPDIGKRRVETLSGGQAQRLAIARSLAIGPQILVCDEPVSALDSSTRVKIVELLEQLQDEDQIALVYISHELSSVSRLADEVLVLRDGVAVEHGSTAEIFTSPRHDFTRELLSGVGHLGSTNFSYNNPVQ
ncbi:MAG: ABC transporter ATP-binding protein [Canibacter sp.]